MSDAKRKLVEQKFYVDKYDLCGKVVDIIKNLQGYVEKYGDSAEVEFEISYGYYDDHYIEVEGRYWREETDKEYNLRLARTAKSRETAKRKRAEAKVKKEKQERTELARLLKKYGEEA